MIYGVAVTRRSGDTQFLAVNANNQRTAAERARSKFAESDVEAVSVQAFETMIYEQYDGIAVLTEEAPA